MPFCVNCGVELSCNTSSCPLCNTSVPNEYLSFGGREAAEYNDTAGTAAGRLPFSGPHFAGLFTLCMLLPMSIPIIIDWVISGDISWSAYSLSATLLVWFICIQPVLVRRNRLFHILIRSCIAVALFLLFLDFYSSPHAWAGYPAVALVYIVILWLIIRLIRRRYFKIWAAALATLIFLVSIDWLQGGFHTLPWSLFIGSPLILCCAAAGSIIQFFLKRVIHSHDWNGELLSASLSCFFIGIFVIFLEILLYARGPEFFPSGWSLFTFTPLLGISWFLFYAAKHSSFRQSVKRRFHM